MLCFIKSEYAFTMDVFGTLRSRRVGLLNCSLQCDQVQMVQFCFIKLQHDRNEYYKRNVNFNKMRVVDMTSPPS